MEEVIRYLAAHPTLTFSDVDNGSLVCTLFGVTSSRACARKPT